MNGRLFYLSIAALIGTLVAQMHVILFSILFLLYMLFLLRFKKLLPVMIIMVLTTFFIFFLSAHFVDKSNHTKIPENTTHLQIKFEDSLSIDGNRLMAEATETKYKEKIIILYKIKSEMEKERLQRELKLGQLCKVKAVLKKPGLARNPHAFDYGEYLSRNHIYWLAEIQSLSSGQCATYKGKPLLLIKKVRETGINHIKSHFPPDISPLAAALIFGDRSLFSPELIIAYQKIGIIHLLAISGLHVSLLAAMFYYLGLRAGMTKDLMKRILYILLPVYAILAGGSPSVNRAVLMMLTMMFFSQRKFAIRLSAFDAINVTFMSLVLFNPMVLYDVGFQLSFSVSFGLILSAPIILKSVSNKILLLIITSYIAQLTSLPFILYYFFEISLLGLITNLIYIPFFSFVLMPGVFILFIFQMIFGKAPEFFSNLLSFMITFSNNLAQSLSGYPIFDITTGRYSIPVSLLLLMVVISVFYFWENLQNKRKLIVILLLPWLFIALQKIPPKLNAYGEVTMIDVGQGDSILIQMPHDEGTYLIDTGGTITFAEEAWQKRSKTYDVGQDVVVPFLNGKGITEIDKLILTHGDMDHIGGALAVIKSLRVREIVLPAVKEQSQAEKSIIQQAGVQGIPVHEVSEGDYWENGSTAFYVLNPSDGFAGEKNSGSIVLNAKLGGLSWLFTGDLDGDGEEKIVKSYPELKIDVLKVGHHGSKTSTSKSFINKFNPSVALISVGEGNRFGHPTKEVLDILEECGSVIFRTDEQGAITYRFSQGTGTFSSHLP
jgi:competence protein ComEC